MLCLLFAIAVATLGGPATAQPERNALSEALAPPITQELLAARRAPVLAWAVRTAGDYSVKVARAPLFRPSTILAGGADDGLPLSLIDLSPDGTMLAFARGEYDDPDGRTPNPASLAAGARRGAFLISTAGGAPLALPAGDSFSFAPAGDRIAWIGEGGVMAAPVSRGAKGKLALGKAALLFADIGAIGAFAWSPDGRAIAFTSQRSGHTIIGVYRQGALEIIWLAPSFESDTAPSWSPDGHRIAFVRVPSRDYDKAADVMTGYPFSIVVADPLTGQGDTVFRAKGPDGSAIAESGLRWSAADEVLFLSDESGFSHLYAVSVASGAVRALSSGACEIEAFATNSANRKAALVGNCRDGARRQVDMIDLANPVPRAISAATEIADAAIFIGDTDAAAYRSADARMPQTPAVAMPGQAPQRIDPPQLGPAVLAFQEPRTVSFKAADGQMVTGTLFEPPAIAPAGPSRGIVFVHGGPIRQMLPGWHVSLYYALAYANNQALARAGFTVLAVNYRLGVGFGRAFRNVEGYGPHGQRELQDVVAAGQYLKSLPNVDGKLIGIYGGSVGGYLTAAALARHSDLFKAGVAWHGIYDWERWQTGRNPHVIFTPWGIDAGNLDLARASSPANQTETWTSPVLLVAGDDDRNIDLAETIVLAHRLERKGVVVETLVIPNGLHSFGTQRGWLKVFEATDAFLARRLVH